MNITMEFTIKYKWFFWPCFVVCYASARLGANIERMASFMVNHCIALEIK